MGKREKIFGVRRNIFFLGLVSFFNDFSAEAVQSVMPIFLTTVLGASAAFVGILEGMADALASVLKLFSGWLSDKMKRRKFPAVLGYTLSVGVRPLLAFVSTYWQVFNLRIIDRIGKGFRDAPRDALIAESADRRELGRSFGFHRSADTLGATLGPLFAFLILPILGNNYRQFFLIAFVIGLGAIFSFVFVRDRGGDVSDLPPTGNMLNPTDVKKPKFNFRIFKTHKKFILIVFSIFIFGLGGLPIILVLLRGAEIGLKGGELPLLYFIYSLTFVLTAIPLGRLADKIGEKWVIAGGFLAAALAYFGLKNAVNLPEVVFFFIILGFYSAATDGLQRMLAAKYADGDLLATGQGFLNMAVGLSSLGAGVVGGLLWTKFGSGTALAYAGVLSLIGLILFLFITMRHHSANTEEIPVFAKEEACACGERSRTASQ